MQVHYIGSDFMVDTPISGQDMRIILSDRSVSYLEKEFRKGIESGESEGWISEESLRAKYR